MDAGSVAWRCFGDEADASGFPAGLIARWCLPPPRTGVVRHPPLPRPIIAAIAHTARSGTERSLQTIVCCGWWPPPLVQVPRRFVVGLTFPKHLSDTTRLNNVVADISEGGSCRYAVRDSLSPVPPSLLLTPSQKPPSLLRPARNSLNRIPLFFLCRALPFSSAFVALCTRRRTRSPALPCSLITGPSANFSRQRADSRASRASRASTSHNPRPRSIDHDRRDGYARRKALESLCVYPDWPEADGCIGLDPSRAAC